MAQAGLEALEAWAERVLESPFYREILEEGRATGWQEGAVLAVLAVRFGRVPAEVEAPVRRLRGRKALEGWLRQAVVVESLPILGEELGRGKREG